MLHSNDPQSSTSSSSKSRSRAHSLMGGAKLTRQRHRENPPPPPQAQVPPRAPSHKRSCSFAATSAPASAHPGLYAPSHGVYEHPQQRPPAFRSTSNHGHGEPLIRQVHTGTPQAPNGAIHTPTVSFSSSSRSRSNSSVQIGGVSILKPRARTPSSSSLHRSDIVPRPILKQNHTWHGDPPQKSRRKSQFRPHALLDGAHKNVLLYDILFAPGPHSVLNSTTRHPIPSASLMQPATDPPILTEMVLKSHKFNWSISVFPRSPGDTGGEGSKSTKFYIAGSKTPQSIPGAITTMDVLLAVHSSLSTRVTQAEWAMLGAGSPEQKRVTRAYERRCEKMGGGWEGGVRRVDLLGRKTRLVGIEPEPEGDGRTWKLVFSKS